MRTSDREKALQASGDDITYIKSRVPRSADHPWVAPSPLGGGEVGNGGEGHGLASVDSASVPRHGRRRCGGAGGIARGPARSAVAGGGPDAARLAAPAIG